MRSTGNDGVRRPDPQDRDLWRRSQTTTAQPDEAERFLDLAAYADGRLDEDDEARVAALLARDSAAAADVAAARSFNGTAASVDARIIARADTLVAEEQRSPDAAVIDLRPRLPAAARPWFSAASWSGLAAAIALASWLGFDLGRGFYDFGAAAHGSDDVSATELIDPALHILRDFTENSQI